MSKYNFKQKIKRLEEIVQILESDIEDLDKVVSLYKEGMKLSKELSEKLQALESKIEIVGKEENE